MNYTLVDLLTVSLATALFALFGLIPGYVVGWFADVFHFRQRTLAERMLISPCLSLALVPVLVYWVERFLSITAVWVLIAVTGLCFLGIIVWNRSRPVLPVAAPSPAPALLVVFFAFGVLLGLFCMVDLQIGQRLYLPTVAYDYNVRVSFVSALSRAGIPPTNPFFFPGHSVPLRYHYFSLIASSLVTRLAPSLVSARQAFLAGALWTGISLISIVALYLLFFATRGSKPWRRVLIGIALLSVTGADLIPTLLFMKSGLVAPSMEWWNEPVMAWVHAMLWVPHHVAGLVACLFGFLVIWQVPQLPRRQAAVNVALGGLAFATAVGTSIYISFAFAVFIVVWLGIAASRKQLQEVVTFACAGSVALIASLPFLLDLRTSSSTGNFLSFAIRPFSFAPLLLEALHANSSWAPVANLASLPLNYFVEFGFFFAVAWWWLRRLRRARRPLTREELAGVVMLVTIVLLCTFFRSATIRFNDLGWRGMMFAQFMLLLWAVDLLELWFWPPVPKTPEERRAGRVGVFAVAFLLLLGFAGSCYEIVITRSFGILSDAGLVRNQTWLAADRNLGARTYALRQIYDNLRRSLPPDAVVQHNPMVFVGDLFYGMYADRQSAVGTALCGTTFGGRVSDCENIFAPVNELFVHPAAVSAASATRLCEKLSISVIVLKDTDPSWQAHAGWPVELRPLESNAFARVYGCGERQSWSQLFARPQ